MKHIHQILLLALGGTLGAIARFYVYLFADKYLNQTLPWGTLIVNLIGSLLIGVFWALFEKASIPLAVRLFVFIGILGSFTTFSTFAFDNFGLLHQGLFKVMFINILLNNIGGLFLCVTGVYLTRLLL